MIELMSCISADRHGMVVSRLEADFPMIELSSDVCEWLKMMSVETMRTSCAKSDAWFFCDLCSNV
jgi:hypothetical protein